MSGRLNGYTDPGLETAGSRVSWSVSRCRYVTLVPAGLRVRFLPDPSGGRFVLDEFPEDLFPANSLVRHDAEHYGLPLATEDLRCRQAAEYCR